MLVHSNLKVALGALAVGNLLMLVIKMERWLFMFPWIGCMPRVFGVLMGEEEASANNFNPFTGWNAGCLVRAF